MFILSHESFYTIFSGSSIEFSESEQCAEKPDLLRKLPCHSPYLHIIIFTHGEKIRDKIWMQSAT